MMTFLLYILISIPTAFLMLLMADKGLLGVVCGIAGGGVAHIVLDLLDIDI